MTGPGLICDPKPNSNLMCFWPLLSYEFSAMVKDDMYLFSCISDYRIIFRTGMKLLQLFLLSEIQLAIPDA